jgi:hypothetical protein
MVIETWKDGNMEECKKFYHPSIFPFLNFSIPSFGGLSAFIILIQILRLIGLFFYCFLSVGASQVGIRHPIEITSPYALENQSS